MISNSASRGLSIATMATRIARRQLRRVVLEHDL